MENDFLIGDQVEVDHPGSKYHRTAGMVIQITTVDGAPAYLVGAPLSLAGFSGLLKRAEHLRLIHKRIEGYEKEVDSIIDQMESRGCPIRFHNNMHNWPWRDPRSYVPQQEDKKW